ncbi:hypothetical protein CDL15_Pgr021522 [Punica granatum]|uniref:Protein transport protein sec16 n=1 Tax=Punica granatum TaxID=22663 RepID=A0A218XMG0_PUNGR|nr:hypothetical protein CDL15_Pgr021522 [Punica granatum]
MASNPPFDMEDQTDEDFFDNLVNDDDELKPPGPVLQSDPGVADAFSNLSIKDSCARGELKEGARSDSVDFDDGSVDTSTEDKNKVLPSSSSLDFDSVVEPEVSAITCTDNSTTESGSEAMVKRDLGDASSELPSAVTVEGNVLAHSNSFKFDTLVASNEKRLASEGMANMFKSKNVENVGGIKEVGWNSFYADSTTQSGTGTGTGGFGSYSDFFSDLGGGGGDFPGNVEQSFSSEAKIASSSAEYGADGSGNVVSYTQYEGGQGYEAGGDQSGNMEDLNSSQYWENLFPGWRYDPNTQQWYQVDGSDGNMNVQETSDSAAVNESAGSFQEKTEVSYLQQSAQSVGGTVNETGKTETVSNWNQGSEGNNGYPEHMVFDPQFPGWYYDMIAQEWLTLESYTSSDQSTSQSHDHQNQNSHNDGSIYGDYGQVNNYASQGRENQNSHNDGSIYGDYGQVNNYASQGHLADSQDNHWVGQYNQQNADYAWAQQAGGYRQFDASYVSSADNHIENQSSVNSFPSSASYGMLHQSHSKANGTIGMPSFIPSQPANQPLAEQRGQGHFSNDIYQIQKSTGFSQQPFQTPNDFSHTHNVGRSSAGRPAHALVTFGFGGKLIVMKDASNLSFATKDSAIGSISMLNIMEVVQKNDGGSTIGFGGSGYFSALCHQSFPGPLVGGNVGNKELNKWIDERIGNCESSGLDYRRAETLRLLLSLLKIACQHYGKLRSPFGTDTALKEGDSPEVAVAKLFASAKRNSAQFGDYVAQRQCLQLLPPAGQVQATASEVQNLLVSGKKKEALQLAQEGQLWGPALVLASQLGDQYYVDTVKQMALRQLVPGSPLRTLCLLIAGQPAEVFSAETTTIANVSHAPMSQQQAQIGANCMLEDWEENLAVIAANRTKDDELVIMHLGDCLWKERSENMAAHLCYLVAEANFESYSDSARMCLVGADHWKCPRTYASPDAIQRTELYEYSKVLGNSQFILLPFQPYKIIYAHMLAEVGKVSDSLKYCQALLRSLKTGRAPEVEMWKQVVVSLEDRGGYSANLAPAKLVGKLLNFFDSTAHRVVNGGGLPPPAPSINPGVVQVSEQFNRPMDQKALNSQSSTAVPSLVPSLSMEPISEWTGDNNRMTVQNRSVSEPDFGRSPRQVNPSSEVSPASGERASASGGTSRFARFGFGSQLLQKTVGLVLRPRSDKQAKLGEKNKFYYDEKLKRWVEEGAEPPAEEAALAPPPTTAAFQNGTSDYNLKSALKSEGFVANGSPTDFKSPMALPGQTSGMPPMPPSSNQFSARGRMGIRARYVDTFNKGGGSPANLFQSPSVPAAKPTASTGTPKFFIPAPVAASAEQQQMESIAESTQEEPATNEAPSTSAAFDLPSSSSAPIQTAGIQRFPSTGNIPRRGSMVDAHSSFQSNSRRTASWSGSFNDSFNHPPKGADIRPLGEQLGMPPSSFMPSDRSPLSRMPVNGGGSFDELQEVEL